VLLCISLCFESYGLAGDLPARKHHANVAAAIDSAIDAALAESKIPASPPADDAEFLRRVYLDLTGTIPTVKQAVAFIDQEDPGKRSALIDQLLASPLYGRHFGALWQNRFVPLSPENTREFNKPLFLWLANGFNAGRPWSKTVSELLMAEGERENKPELGYYLSSLNTVERFVEAERVAGSAAQLFMGINLRCAQCHDHPFADWTQNDFWGVAAFFGRVGYTREDKEHEWYLTESRKIRNKDNQPVSTARDDATIQIKDATEIVKARFLSGDEPVLRPDESFRAAFVAWLTSPHNDRFNKAAVNRLWGHCFGRGLVNPIEDLHDGNPASHPELLKILADEFAAAGHDEKHMLRCICNSSAYQRCSQPLSENAEDTTRYSTMALKQLSAEVLHDAVAQVTDGRMVDDKDLVKSVTNAGRDFWLWSFSNQSPATEYTHGVPQSLKMLNSGLANARPPLVLEMSRKKLPPEQAIETLFLYALSRRPTPDETKLYIAYRSDVRSDEDFYKDIIWILINSSEFLFNH
jgi:hypothetical protein